MKFFFLKDKILHAISVIDCFVTGHQWKHYFSENCRLKDHLYPEFECQKCKKRFDYKKITVDHYHRTATYLECSFCLESHQAANETEYQIDGLPICTYCFEDLSRDLS
jgi:hypothetical protein